MVSCRQVLSRGNVYGRSATVHHVEHAQLCQCFHLLGGMLLFCSIMLLRVLSGPTSSSRLEDAPSCGAGSAAATILLSMNRPGLEAPLQLNSRPSELARVASPCASPEARLAADSNPRLTPLAQAHQMHVASCDKRF